MGGSSATWCLEVGLLDELSPEEEGAPRLLAARNSLSKGLYFDPWMGVLGVASATPK